MIIENKLNCLNRVNLLKVKRLTIEIMCSRESSCNLREDHSLPCKVAKTIQVRTLLQRSDWNKKQHMAMRDSLIRRHPTLLPSIPWSRCKVKSRKPKVSKKYNEASDQSLPSWSTNRWWLSMKVMSKREIMLHHQVFSQSCNATAVKACRLVHNLQRMR